MLNLCKSKVRVWVRFWLHRLGGVDFSHHYRIHNVAVLSRLKEGEWLEASMQGRLTLLTTKRAKVIFFVKNLLCVGACRSRVEQSLFTTFLLLVMEVLNPLSKKTLPQVICRKERLFLKLLQKINRINGKKYNTVPLLHHLDVYKRHSLLQQHLIGQMEQAVAKAKTTPLIVLAKEGLAKGIAPKLITHGLSGSYWMRGPDRTILGLFKPYDEEIHAPNNPMGATMQGALGHRRVRFGNRVGEAAHREVAAYVVDQFFGFGIVPRTQYATFTHPFFYSATENRLKTRHPKKKLGSFQEYIAGFCPLHKLTIEEGNQIDLEEFQLLILLDVILGNSDRNSGNFLVNEEKIAAIDHGLCFPDYHEELSLWYWTLLAQGEKPFFSPIAKLIKQFPAVELSNKLQKKCFIDSTALLRMRERLALLAKGVEANLTPHALAALMTQENFAKVQQGERVVP